MSDESQTTAPASPRGPFARGRSFTPRSAKKIDPDAAARQGQAVRMALAAFPNAGEAMGFLNTHDVRLGARPIDLAVASVTGLASVEQAIATNAPGRGETRPKP